jgi:acyl transferase domain-containing protein
MEGIAVIGIGCRFSGGATSPEDFWQMLCEGRTGHGKIPSSRYQASAWHHPSHDRKGAVCGTPIRFTYSSFLWLLELTRLLDQP